MKTWLAAIAAAAAALAVLALVRQNLQLKERFAAEEPQRAKTQRRLGEDALTGRCRPFFEAGQTPVRPVALDVSIYFSLRRDCRSCVGELIRQWNVASGFRVKGYAEVDGTVEEQMLADLKPAFPIVRVRGIEGTLPFTPAVVVSDPVSGRILLTHAPLVSEKNDDAFARRVRSLALPCAE